VREGGGEGRAVGRRAVLWESGKDHVGSAGPVDPTNTLAPFLPQDGRGVGTHPDTDRSIVYPPCGTGEEALKMGFSFYVRPEAGQEGVPARHKLWRMAGADAERYGQHDSFMIIDLRTENTDVVGKFVWSLLYTQ
jgi:hypothetical protein